jgi:hypothetical protein
LREEPDQKFLLYHEGPFPEDPDNWLLDVQLAFGAFRSDQVSEKSLGQVIYLPKMFRIDEKMEFKSDPNATNIRLKSKGKKILPPKQTHPGCSLYPHGGAGVCLFTHKNPFIIHL